MVVEKGTKTDASCRKLDFSDIPELKIPLQQEFHRQKSREEGYNPGNYVVVRKDGMPYQPDYLSNCLRQFVSLPCTAACDAARSAALLCEYCKQQQHPHV